MISHGKAVWIFLLAIVFGLTLSLTFVLSLSAMAAGGDFTAQGFDPNSRYQSQIEESGKHIVVQDFNEVKTAKPPGWVEPDTDRPGSDYRSFDLSGGPEQCQEVCADDPNCRAYTYVRPGIQGRLARCWLKSGVPALVPNDCCVSGVKPSATEKPLVIEVTPEEPSGGKVQGGMVLVSPIEPPATKGGEETVRSTPGSQAKKSKAGKSPEPVAKSPPSDVVGSIDIEGKQKKTGQRQEDTGVTAHIQSSGPQHKGSQRQRHHGKKESKPRKKPSEEILESIKIGEEKPRQTIITIQPNKKEPASPYEEILKALGRSKVASARAGSGEISKTPPTCRADAKGGAVPSNANQVVWTKLPAITSHTSPAITSIKRYRIYMVVIAHTGCVYYSSTNSPGGWTPWQSIGSSFRAHPSTPPVIVQKDNTLYLFVRGKDDNLHVAHKNREGYWSGWNKLTSSGLVKGRISVAITRMRGGGRDVIGFHLLYRSENSAKKPTVVYLRFNSNWKQQGPGKIWQDALEGVIGTDGERDILTVIRTVNQELLLVRKVRQASRWIQFQQVGGRGVSGAGVGIFDISNVVFYAGAYHLAYSRSYVSNPEFGGGHVNAIEHTWIPRGKVDSGLVQTITDYTPEGNSHPKTRLIVYRKKLVAAYSDPEGFIRYAYWDTADPATPWIGNEIVDKGSRTKTRPALAVFNRRDTLSGNDYNNNNFGNDLFAAVKEDGADTIGFINFSRAIFIKKIDAQLAVYNSMTGTVCTDQGKANSPVLVADIARDGRPFYTEIGYVFWTMPSRLLGDAFKKTAEKACKDRAGSGRFDAPQGGACKDVRYPVMVGILSDGGESINICSGIWHLRSNDYKGFWEEMGHTLAGHRLGFHDSGKKKELKGKGKPYYPTRENEKLTGISLSALKEGDTLFGKGVRGDRKCDYGTAPGGRCRGFTGIASNYDVGTRQHSFIYAVYYYFSDGDQLRRWVKEDTKAGSILLQRKYEWIKKNLFKGVEFGKDNELKNGVF